MRLQSAGVLQNKPPWSWGAICQVYHKTLRAAQSTRTGKTKLGRGKFLFLNAYLRFFLSGGPGLFSNFQKWILFGISMLFFAAIATTAFLRSWLRLLWGMTECLTQEAYNSIHIWFRWSQALIRSIHYLATGTKKWSLPNDRYSGPKNKQKTGSKGRSGSLFTEYALHMTCTKLLVNSYSLVWLAWLDLIRYKEVSGKRCKWTPLQPPQQNLVTRIAL